LGAKKQLRSGVKALVRAVAMRPFAELLWTFVLMPIVVRALFVGSTAEHVDFQVH